jgi:hypothetical protein
MKFLSSSSLVFRLSSQSMCQASHLSFAQASIMSFAQASHLLFAQASHLSSAQVSHQPISIKRMSKNLSMLRKLDVWRRIESDVRRRIECVVRRRIKCVVRRRIECVVRRMIEFVNYRKISRRRRKNFWRDEIYWRLKSLDVRRCYTIWKERLKNANRKERKKNVCVNQANNSSNSLNALIHLQLISLCFQWMRNRLSTFRRSLEWLMSWYVRQETHSLVCLHLFKMLTSIHS